MDKPQRAPEPVPQLSTLGGISVSEILQESGNSIREIDSLKSTRDQRAAWKEFLVVRIVEDIIDAFLHSKNAHSIRGVCCCKNLPEPNQGKPFMVPVAWLVPNDTPFASFSFVVHTHLSKFALQ